MSSGIVSTLEPIISSEKNSRCRLAGFVMSRHQVPMLNKRGQVRALRDLRDISDGGAGRGTVAQIRDQA